MIRHLLVFFLFISAQSQAQEACSHEIRGTVEDHEGVVLVGATIWIDAINRGTTSALEGDFILQDMCAGSYAISVSYLGYEAQHFTVRVPTSRSLIIKLRPSTKVLHDLVIEGEHVQKHGLSQSLSIVSGEELKARKGKPLGEILRHVPGVTSMTTGPGIFKPVIHGLHGQRILILNNGIRQEGQQWGVEHAPEIDPYIAAEVEVVKGAETIRYGSDALGGVIMVNTPSLPHSDAIGGEFNTALSSNNRMGVFSALVEGGLGKTKDFGWRMQGTVKKGGDFHAPDYNLSNTGMEELNFSGALGLKRKDHEIEVFISTFNTAIGILRSAHTGNLTDLQNSIQNERPWYIEDFTYAIENPRQQTNHHLVKVDANKTITGIGKLAFRYGGQLNQRKEYDIRRGARNNTPALSLDLYSHVLDLTLDHTHAAWSGSVGVNGTWKQNDNVLSTGILPDYQQRSAGIFFIEKRKLNKWLLEAGVRMDYQHLDVAVFDQQDNLLKPSYDFYFASASLGSSVYFNPGSRLSLHTSVSSRPPHSSELFSQGLHHSAAAIEEGLMISNGNWNDDLNDVNKEISYKAVSTYQYADDRLTFEVTAHVNYIYNYVYLRPYETRLDIRGYFPVFHYRQTDALLAGGDASVNWLLTNRWRYAASVSYLYAANLTQHDRLPMIAPPTIDNEITYTLPALHNWRNLYVKASFPLGLKQTRTPETIYPADLDDHDTSDGKLFDFMPAPSAYLLMDLEIGAQFPWTNRDLTIVLTAENLLNTSYRNYMNRLRYFTDETGRNFTLRMTYTFHSHK